MCWRPGSCSRAGTSPWPRARPRRRSGGRSGTTTCRRCSGPGGHRPGRLDRAGLAISAGQFSRDQVLESWTLHDPRNPAFTPPGGRTRDAAEVMRAAFAQAVAHLRAVLRGGPSAWAWGRLHTRRFPSLTQAAALGYGPRPAGGDPWTVDAADGGLASTAGPSWRMIVRLTRG